MGNILFFGFADFKIKKSTLKFDVFRKQTNKGNYLKADSNHPEDHKRAIVRSLVDRAENV